MVAKGFIPNQDTGQIQGSTEAPQDISFDAMVQRQQQVADLIGKDPDVDAFSSSVGGGGGVSGGNAGPRRGAPKAAPGAADPAGAGDRAPAPEAHRHPWYPPLHADPAAG